MTALLNNKFFIIFLFIYFFIIIYYTIIYFFVGPPTTFVANPENPKKKLEFCNSEKSLEKTLERNISQEIIAFCESEMGITN